MAASPGVGLDAWLGALLTAMEKIRCYFYLHKLVHLYTMLCESGLDSLRSSISGCLGAF